MLLPEFNRQAFDASVSTEFNVTNMSAAEITCFRTRSLHFLAACLAFVRVCDHQEPWHGPFEAGLSLKSRHSAYPRFVLLIVPGRGLLLSFLILIVIALVRVAGRTTHSSEDAHRRSPSDRDLY